MALTRDEWDREFFTSHVEYLSRIDRISQSVTRVFIMMGFSHVRTQLRKLLVSSYEN